uniref:Uncharacterized protein n=1 Tax=Triticum urartu TaxID=4572 RepID=A0A8R7Q752_TRIUA
MLDGTPVAVDGLHTHHIGRPTPVYGTRHMGACPCGARPLQAHAETKDQSFHGWTYYSRVTSREWKKGGRKGRWLFLRPAKLPRSRAMGILLHQCACCLHGKVCSSHQQTTTFVFMKHSIFR